MDDLLGLNEINTNTNSHSNGYFEEEDKKEELYIKMIEDRIMFKIRKEIIEPLISDFNVKTDINMCEILKLKDDVSELKECVEREKNKNIELTDIIDRLIYNYGLIKNKQNEIKEDLTIIHNDIEAIGVCLTNIQNDMVRMEDNINELDLLREQLTHNVTQTDKLSNIISKLKVYAPQIPGKLISYNDLKDITTTELYVSGNYRQEDHTYYYDIHSFYHLKKLTLQGICCVDFKYMYNDYLEILILYYGGGQSYGDIWRDNKGEMREGISILNLKYLSSLKIIKFEQIYDIDVDEFIKELSSYEHKIETFVFIDCLFNSTKKFNKLNTYCDENNIKIKSN